MWGHFLFAANAILPLVLIIALGIFLRRSGFFSRAFFEELNKFGFHWLLPIMLFMSVYSVRSLGEIHWSLVVYTVCAIVAVFLLAALTARFFVADRKSRGVAIQCAFRPNSSSIALPVALAVGGAATAAPVAVTLAFGIPVLNFLGVLALSLYGGEGEKIDLKRTAKTIATNPLILGCLAGLAALGVRALLPVNAAGEPVFLMERDLPFLHEFLSMVARCATPLTLLGIGGLLELDFKSAGGVRDLVFGCVWRVLLSPVLVLGAAALLTRAGVLPFGSTEFAVLLPFFGASAPAASAVMAAEMHANADLARQYVVFTTVLIAVTLPLLITASLTLGLITQG